MALTRNSGHPPTDGGESLLSDTAEPAFGGVRLRSASLRLGVRESNGPRHARVRALAGRFGFRLH